MAHQHMVRHCYIVVAHHMCGPPLMSILSIALFLVVGALSGLTVAVHELLGGVTSEAGELELAGI